MRDTRFRFIVVRFARSVSHTDELVTIFPALPSLPTRKHHDLVHERMLVSRDRVDSIIAVK